MGMPRRLCVCPTLYLGAFRLNYVLYVLLPSFTAVVLHTTSLHSGGLTGRHEPEAPGSDWGTLFRRTCEKIVDAHTVASYLLFTAPFSGVNVTSARHDKVVFVFLLSWCPPVLSGALPCSLSDIRRPSDVPHWDQFARWWESPRQFVSPREEFTDAIWLQA